MAENRMEKFKAQMEPELRGLYRAARRLAGNRLDAEDLVQETCLQAWQKLPAGIDAGHLRNWLHRVLYNRFIDGVRRRKHGPVAPLDGADDPTAEMISPDPGPDDLAELDEDERTLHHAWMQLEPAQRALLALRAEGFDLVEIEEIMAISRVVLRARLHRARRSLALQLKEAADLVLAPARAGRIR
jgi:RNA polymerase sigma-70 factor (ECF subfamily)